MTKNFHDNATVVNGLDLDLTIEELEPIAAPGIATSPSLLPGPRGGLATP